MNRLRLAALLSLVAALVIAPAALASPGASGAGDDTRTYAVAPGKAYEAVLRAMGRLAMPIESSNPAGGHVKSSTAYRSGLFMTLEVTNVFVTAAEPAGSTVRIERLTGRSGKAPKAAPDAAAFERFFTALDGQVTPAP